MTKSQLKITNIVIISFVLFPAIAFAAELYLEPAQEEYHQGDVFIVEVKLNTEGEYINTANIELSFSQEILEVKDISKGNSILTLHIEEPYFSNEEGIVSFIGGVPAGYQGWDGLLAKVIFKIKDTGQKAEIAEVNFLDSSQVLLNDGLGTPADPEKKGAILTILSEEREFPKDEWLEELKEDIVSPESFEIELGQDVALFEGKYFIIFSTTDKQTGIDYYEVKEGEKDWLRTESPYLLKDQKLKSIIRVRAVDKAGNERIVLTGPSKPSKKTTWQEILLRILLALVAGGTIWWILRKIRSSVNSNRKNEKV